MQDYETLIDQCVESARARDVDALCKNDDEAKTVPVLTVDYSDINDFKRDSGDVCLPDSDEDLCTLRRMLRDVLIWIELEQKADNAGGRDAGNVIWHSRVMTERLAALGERIALAAWEQGYRARNFGEKE